MHSHIQEVRLTAEEREIRRETIRRGGSERLRRAPFEDRRRRADRPAEAFSCRTKTVVRRDLPEPQAGGDAGPLRGSLLRARRNGERNQGATACSLTGHRPQPCAPMRLYFATFASVARERQGPGKTIKFLKVAVRISARRVPLSFSWLGRSRSPGSWRTCGRLRKLGPRLRSLTRAASRPSAKVRLSFKEKRLIRPPGQGPPTVPKTASATSMRVNHSLPVSVSRPGGKPSRSFTR